MSQPYPETYIQRVPLFSRLPPYQLQLVTQAFEARRFNQGDFILHQGYPAPGLIILAAGMATWIQAMPDGRGQTVGAMQAGEYFHTEALFDDVVEQAYLRADYPSIILVLTRQAMANLLAAHPELKAPLGLEQKQGHHMHDLRFDTQRENEKVLLETRRHRWAYLRHMWMPVGIMLAIWILAAFVPNIALFLIPFSLLVFAGFAGYLYSEWANDAVIITTQRVIQITRTILTLEKKQREVSVENIQEADAQIPAFDFLARIFRYGHIELKTAGSEGNVVLDFMPNPMHVQKLILEDIQNYKQSVQTREREALQAEVASWTSGSFQAGQQASPQADKPKNAASEEKLKNIYNEGEGPISPFISSFPSDSGGIVYRKHWIVWLSAVFIPMMLIFGTIIGTIVLLIFGVLQTVGVVSWATVLVMLIVSVIWLWYADWDWRHDYYLVTDNSITIVYQRPLWLQNESDQILLKQVDSVVAETRGIRQRLFRYGDVKVSLVGADDYKLFDDVANPLGIQNEISSRQQRMKQKELNSQERQQREILGEYFSVYHEQQQKQQQQQANYDGQVAQQSPLSPRPSPFGYRPPRPSMSRGRPYQPQQGYNPQAGQRPNMPSSYPQGQAPYTPSPQQQGYTPSQGQAPHTPSPQQGYTPSQPQAPYTPSQGQAPYTPSPQQQGYTPQGQPPYTPSPQQQGYTPQGQPPYTPSPQQQGYTPQGQPPVQGNYPPPPPPRRKPPQNPPSRFPHNRKKP